jgi:hypothetical protein
VIIWAVQESSFLFDDGSTSTHSFFATRLLDYLLSTGFTADPETRDASCFRPDALERLGERRERVGVERGSPIGRLGDEYVAQLHVYLSFCLLYDR